MDNGTASDEISRLLGPGLGDGLPPESSSSMRAAGDYYRDPDDVTRGTMMGSGPGEAFNSAFLMSGDFYAPEDKVVRGVTFPAGDHFGMDSQFGFGDMRGGMGGCDFAMDPKFKGFADEQFPDIMEPSTLMAQSMPTTYFSDGDAPLPQPDDEFFQLCPTTLHLYCVKPFEIGNGLLDFLAKEVTSSVTKVRPEKFCIKADVFMDNVMCTLKIKVFQGESPGQVAVEFQRRRGDVSTFNGVFQRVSMYLNDRFTLIRDIPPVSSVLSAPPPLPPALVPLSKGDATMEMSPFFDMAAQTHNTPIQAESAAMLANLTEEEKQTSLCTPEAAQAVKALLKEDVTEVALPTARLVLDLSKYTAAIPYFIAIGQEKECPGYLDLSIEKLRARTSCALVRRFLAQAVEIAINSCVAQLSQDKVSQLKDDISAAIMAISKELAFKQVSPGATADTDAIDQSLKRAAVRLSSR